MKKKVCCCKNTAQEHNASIITKQTYTNQDTWWHYFQWQYQINYMVKDVPKIWTISGTIQWWSPWGFHIVDSLPSCGIEFLSTYLKQTRITLEEQFSKSYWPLDMSVRDSTVDWCGKIHSTVGSSIPWAGSLELNNSGKIQQSTVKQTNIWMHLFAFDFGCETSSCLKYLTWLFTMRAVIWTYYPNKPFPS